VKSDTAKSEAGVNPFSSRFVRPGAMDFVYPAGDTAQLVLGKFRAAGRHGQILGPHGSGKSTLLADLCRRLRGEGETPVQFELRDGQSRLPAGWRQAAEQARATLLAIDGYEQLGRLARCSLRRACRRSGRGLLVTAHRNVGLPTIFETRCDLALAKRLVADLSASAGLGAERRLPESLIEACFDRHKPDLREMLFELYDLYEAASRRDPAFADGAPLSRARS
jgi:hypothetical protein